MQQAGRRNPRFTSAKSPRKLRKGTREMPYFPSQILYPRIYSFLLPPFINRPTSSVEHFQRNIIRDQFCNIREIVSGRKREIISREIGIAARKSLNYFVGSIIILDACVIVIIVASALLATLNCPTRENKYLHGDSGEPNWPMNKNLSRSRAD